MDYLELSTHQLRSSAFRRGQKAFTIKTNPFTIFGIFKADFAIFSFLLIKTPTGNDIHVNMATELICLTTKQKRQTEKFIIARKQLHFLFPYSLH